MNKTRFFLFLYCSVLYFCFRTNMCFIKIFQKWIFSRQSGVWTRLTCVSSRQVAASSQRNFGWGQAANFNYVQYICKVKRESIEIAIRNLNLNISSKTFCCVQPLLGLFHCLQYGWGRRCVVGNVRAVHIHVNLEERMITSGKD